MITYFAEANLELRVHENCLDIHDALLEIESWERRIGNWGQDLKNPRFSEHQHRLLGPEVLVCKLKEKVISKIRSFRFFF